MVALDSFPAELKLSKKRLHQRMGHIGGGGHSLDCDECKLAKMERRRFRRLAKVKYKSGLPARRFSVDFVGPLRPTSITGCTKVLVVVDDISKFVVVEPVHTESQAPELLRRIVNKMRRDNEVTLGDRIFTHLRSDNGTVFRSDAFQKVAEELNVSLWYAAPWCPQLNSTVERLNKELGYGLRAILAGVSLELWDYACHHWAWCHNNTVIRKNKNNEWLEGLTPIQALKARGDTSMVDKFRSLNEGSLYDPETVRMQRRFGCACFMYLPPDLRSKLGKLSPRATKGVYLGRNDRSSTFRVGHYVPDTTGVLKFNVSESASVVPCLGSEFR